MGTFGHSAATGPGQVTLMWFPAYGGIRAAAGPRTELGPHLLKPAPGADGIRVLMIEDDSSIAEMYRLQLEHDGYAVAVATTGDIAFATLTGSAPDVVLLDLLLPDRSGFEVLAALNERFPNHPPVVILSNYGEPSMIDRGRALGAVDYLVKSRVTPAEISEQIPSWVEQGRGRGQKES